MSVLRTEHLITWNVGDEDNDRLISALMTLIQQYRPVGIDLQEVADRDFVLKEVARKSGYSLIVKNEGSHSAELAMLIRPNAMDGEAGIKQMTARTKVGTDVQGAQRDGYTAAKWYLYQPVKFLGYHWIMVDTHLTPSHQVEAVHPLVNAQVEALVGFVNQSAKMVAIGGDFNEEVDSRLGLLVPLTEVATPFTAPSLGKRAVDIWWIELDRVQARGITVQVKAIPDYPSDHRPVVISFSKVATHRCPICGLPHQMAE